MEKARGILPEKKDFWAFSRASVYHGTIGLITYPLPKSFKVKDAFALHGISSVSIFSTIWAVFYGEAKGGNYILQRIVNSELTMLFGFYPISGTPLVPVIVKLGFQTLLRYISAVDI